VRASRRHHILLDLRKDFFSATRFITPGEREQQIDTSARRDVGEPTDPIDFAGLLTQLLSSNKVAQR
jgi:hypothetical protein